MKIVIDTQELLDRMLLQSSYEDLYDGWTNYDVTPEGTCSWCGRKK